MRTKDIMRALCAALFLFIALCSGAAAVENFDIRIGIARGVTSGRLSGSGLSVRTAKGNTLSIPDGAAVSISGANVKIGGKTMALPVTVSGKKWVGWGGRRYRGTLKLVKAGRGLTVINIVPLEGYVRGVVGREMDPKWNVEALKAQAVLARTYAAVNRGRYANEGFDLTDTTSSQVYGGLSVENANTEAAVASTAGEVLMYGGQMAPIYYYSDSGGSTADAADVWGRSIPYLVPIYDPIKSQSPKPTWQLTLSPSDLTKVAKAAGLRVGDVKSFTVTRRDAFGRATHVRLKGSRGSAEITAHAFRMAVGSNVVRSTHFAAYGDGAKPKYAEKRVAVTTSAASLTPSPSAAVDASRKSAPARSGFPAGSDPLVEMTKLDIFTKDEVYDMLFHPEKREAYLKVGLERMQGRSSAPAPTPSPQKQTEPKPQASGRREVTVRIPVDAEIRGKVHFTGRGWGHGVGLSQWGAKGMADAGSKYREILAHYFPGTTIQK